MATPNLLDETHIVNAIVRINGEKISEASNTELSSSNLLVKGQSTIVDGVSHKIEIA